MKWIHKMAYLALFASSLAMAEMPPSLREAWVQSRNGKYFVHIKSEYVGDFGMGYSVSNFQVYSSEGDAPVLKWEGTFHPGEVLTGALSDDGEVFAYVNPHYQTFGSLLTFYRKGNAFDALYGITLKLDTSKMPGDGANKLWLKEPHAYGFGAREGQPPLFQLTTYSGKVISLDIGEIEQSVERRKQNFDNYLEGKPIEIDPEDMPATGFMYGASFRIMGAIIFSLFPIAIGIKNDNVKGGLIGMVATLASAVVATDMWANILAPLVAMIFCVGIVMYRFRRR